MSHLKNFTSLNLDKNLKSLCIYCILWSSGNNTVKPGRLLLILEKNKASSAGKAESVCSYKTSVTINQTARCHSPADLNIYLRRRVNFISLDVNVLKYFKC